MQKQIKDTLVKVPGKLFIAGEYAVVDGGPAIILAVDQYLTVAIRKCDRSGSLTSSQNPDLNVSWLRTNQGLHFTSSHPYALVQSAMQVTEDYVAEVLGSIEGCYDLRISSDLVDHETGFKYGLGSSGAVTVAVVRALLTHFGMEQEPLLVYKLAVIAQHRIGLKGSFGDLAASSFGGWLAYRRPDEAWLSERLNTSPLQKVLRESWPGLMIQGLSLPKQLHFLAGWTQAVSSTDQFLNQMKSQTQSQGKSQYHQQFLLESRSCVEGLIAAFQAGECSAIQAGIQKNRHLLKTYAEEMDLLIETPALRQLIDIAETQGAVAKTSGAGGGDCGICLVEKTSHIPKIQSAWRDAGIYPLNLREAPAFGFDIQERKPNDSANQSQRSAHWTSQSAVSHPVQF